MASGRTALITGASSGIGAAFARLLAGWGYELTLVARRRDRLEAIAAELAQQYGVSHHVLPADLSSPDQIEVVESFISSMERLDVLINNAGFGTTGYFSDIELDRHVDMIQLQVTAPVRLCRAALPGMIVQGSGAIINVASIAAFWPLPENVSYAASKMYLVVFSRALQAELKGTGIRVQALCPGFTYTEFHDTPDFIHFDRASIPDMLWMTADDLVRLSMRDLDRGIVVCVPGWRNKLMVSPVFLRLTSIVPRGVIRKMLRRVRR